MAELCHTNELDGNLTSSLSSSELSKSLQLLNEPCSLCLRKSKTFTCEMCVLKGDFYKTNGKQNEISYCEMQKKYENVKRLKLAFQTRIFEILDKRKELYEVKEKIMLKRERVRCLHQVFEGEQEAYNTDLLQLKILRHSNCQEQEKLSSNTSKITKVTQVRSHYQARLEDDRQTLKQVLTKLSEVRKKSVITTQQYLFPIQAIPIYPVMGTPSPSHDLDNELDMSKDIEVDDCQPHESVESALAEATQTSYVQGRWVSREDDVNIEYSIVDATCVLHGNTDYSAYFNWIKEHRNGSKGPDDDVGLRNPAFTICAGLTHTAQLSELLAFFFDVILPKRLNYSEFCQNELNKNEFRSAVCHLNTNILHLCFTQHVNPTLLYSDHPLHNLYALLNSASIGRSGAFECHPDQLSTSTEQDQMLTDDSDVDESTNSESDTDWETVPQNVDVPEDITKSMPCTLTTVDMTLSDHDECDGETATSTSLVTSAAASVAALWPWKR